MQFAIFVLDSIRIRRLSGSRRWRDGMGSADLGSELIGRADRIDCCGDRSPHDQIRRTGHDCLRGTHGSRLIIIASFSCRWADSRGHDEKIGAASSPNGGDFVWRGDHAVEP